MPSLLPTSRTAPFRSRPHLLVLALLLLLAAGLRFVALGQTVVETPVRGDGLDYFFYGLNLSESGVYSRDRESAYRQLEPTPDAVRPPAYGFFISLLLEKPLALSPPKEHRAAAIRPVLWAQTVLGVLTVGLLFVAAARFLPLWAATLAGLLAALSPHLANASNYLLTETLFAFLFTLFLAQLAHARTPLHFAAAGLALGLASLTRPTTEYLPVLLLLAMPLLDGRRAWRNWFSLVLAAVGLALLWKLRNLAAIGSTSDPQLLANTLHHGIYPDFMYLGHPGTLGLPYAFDPVLSPDETRIGRILEVLWLRAQASPGEYLHWYLVGKPLALFRWDILPFLANDGRVLVAGDIYLYPTLASPYASNPLFILTYVLSRLVHVPVLLLAAGVTVAAWLPVLRRACPGQIVLLRVLSLCLAYVVAIHCLGAPFPRYAIAFLPLVYLLAATGAALLAGLLARLHGGAAGRPA